MSKFGYWLTLGAYFALFALLMNWYTWLAPSARLPVSLMLILLVGPLLLPLRGLLHGRPRTFLLTSFLGLFYFVLGVDNVAGGSAPPILAWLEIVLALMLYAGCLIYARLAPKC